MASLAVVRLATALRWLRKTKGSDGRELSQRELAAKLGWSQKQVNKLETLQTPSPGVTVFEDVCNRYGVPWGYFHAPGAVDLDPSQYMVAQPVEAQMEALRVQLEQRIKEQIEATVKTMKAKAEPPTGPRRRTG